MFANWLDEFSLEELKITFKSHLIDFLVTVVFGLATGAIELWMGPTDRFFVERDESLSYPLEYGFANGEEVPTWLVIVIAGPLGLVLLVIMRLLATKLLKLRKDGGSDSIHPKSLNILVVLLAFLEALVFTLFLTEFIKRFVGRKRPNFFAMCDYQGYQSAIASKPYNLTEYFNLTASNVPGKLSNCRATAKWIQEAQYSFPSGHSSTIWCSMSFLGIYSIYLFHYYTHKNNMAKGLVGMLFFFVAVLISCTRPRDYWHNFDDILAGAVIGFSCAAFSFILNYSNVLSKLFHLQSKGEEARLVDTHDSVL